MYLPQPVRDVIGRLEDAGYEAFAVGGCVRDTLMGRMPGDYDVTTSARPDDMLRCFADWRVVETGLQHGTVTIVRNGMNVETTSYRIDGVYADHRRPEQVTFTDSLTDDLSRRDFTVNAMAYSDTCGIVDRFDGQKDLVARVVRCVGDPETRFREDGLRILRAMRFAAVLDFTVADETAAAAFVLSPLLACISRERIHAELKKLVCGTAAARVLREFAPIVDALFADSAEHTDEITACARIRIGADALERLETRVQPGCTDARDAALRFAAMLCAFPEADFRAAVRSLKMSRTEEVAIRQCREPIPMGKNEREVFRRMLGQWGEDAAARRILYDYATGFRTDSDTEAALRRLHATAEERLPNTIHDLALGGSDVASLGVSGADIGRVLRMLLDEVIADRLPNDRTALLRHILSLRDSENAAHIPEKTK